MPELVVCLHEQLGVKALTVEDLLQAQKEISAHNRQLKEQTKQLERDMVLLRDHSLLLVRPRGGCCETCNLLQNLCLFACWFLCRHDDSDCRLLLGQLTV